MNQNNYRIIEKTMQDTEKFSFLNTNFWYLEKIFQSHILDQDMGREGDN